MSNNIGASLSSKDISLRSSTSFYTKFVQEGTPSTVTYSSSVRTLTAQSPPLSKMDTVENRSFSSQQKVSKPRSQYIKVENVYITSKGSRKASDENLENINHSHFVFGCQNPQEQGISQNQKPKKGKKNVLKKVLYGLGLSNPSKRNSLNSGDTKSNRSNNNYTDGIISTRSSNKSIKKSGTSSKVSSISQAQQQFFPSPPSLINAQSSPGEMDPESKLKSKRIFLNHHKNNFVEIALLGNGQGGSVYKAIHLPSMAIVAIKRVDLHNPSRAKQALREFTHLQTNLVSIIETHLPGVAPIWFYGENRKATRKQRRHSQQIDAENIRKKAAVLRRESNPSFNRSRSSESENPQNIDDDNDFEDGAEVLFLDKKNC